MSDKIVAINQKAERVKRLRECFDRFDTATMEWKVATLELAAELYAARQEHPGNQAFSTWLFENDLIDRVSKNIRAALIQMGEHFELARATLEDTDRTSPEYIWRDLIQPKLLASSSVATEDGSNPHSIPETPEIVLSAEVFEKLPAENDEEPVANDIEPHPTAPVSPGNSFFGWKRADEVNAVYLGHNTRGAVSRVLKSRGGKEFWELILQAIDQGFLTPTKFQTKEARLRILFPNASFGRSGYCSSFDLLRAKDRKEVREIIMPIALANREAIIAHPENLEEIIQGEIRKQRALRDKERQEQQAAAKLAELPKTEREVIMYGVRLWPKPDNDGMFYNYKDLRSGIWMFRDLDRHLEGGRQTTLTSRAINIRHIIGRMQEYVNHELLDGGDRQRMHNFYHVMVKLSKLMDADPEGECTYEPSPKANEW